MSTNQIEAAISKAIKNTKGLIDIKLIERKIYYKKKSAAGVRGLTAFMKTV
ncbi:hypothetical protein QUF90_26125 [Desulfococcaceae bacterium HSG9]|nr:hypothetical protein [Desulfococcaceae bacterium HSG9]